MGTAIITGASGFIGSHVARRLLDKGDRVISLSPHPEKLSRLGSIFPTLSAIKVSFDDFSNLSNLIDKNEKPESFYYLAWGGYGDATNDYSVQLKNIQPLCDAVGQAAELGCKRFLFSSSFYEYSVDLCSPEDGDLDPITVYGATKKSARLMAQAVARQCKIEFVSVFYSNIFGPGDTSQRSTNVIVNQLLHHKEVNLTSGVYPFDWCYVDDAAKATILAMEKGVSGKSYYVGSNVRPYKDIISDVRDVLAPGSHINLGVYEEVSRVAYEKIDTNALNRDTGYVPETDFRLAVYNTAEWVATLGLQ